MMTFVNKQLNPAILRLAEQVEKALALRNSALRADGLHDVRIVAARDFKRLRRREQVKAVGWGALVAAGAVAMVALPVLSPAVVGGALYAMATGTFMLEYGMIHRQMLDTAADRFNAKLTADIIAAEQETRGDAPENGDWCARMLQANFSRVASARYNRMVGDAKARQEQMAEENNRPPVRSLYADI